MFEYKNALTLIKAFEIIKDEIPHILILKGKITSYWNEVLQPYIVEHNLQTRVILIDRILEDSEVAYLYQNADVFVSPSLMEGFGLTPVEAAIYGTPVICSDIDTLREATMELVDYFSPMDYQQLSCILKLKLQKKDKAKLQSISKKLSSEYSLLEQAKNSVPIYPKKGLHILCAIAFIILCPLSIPAQCECMIICGTFSLLAAHPSTNILKATSE